MLNIVQINLNHCEAAQDMLSQIICETNTDIAIICEQYKNRASTVWAQDAGGKSAIWACGTKAIEERMPQPEPGFVWAKINGIYVYSCYAPPSATLQQFEDMLDRLVATARGRNPIVIAGDFNAWALEWGSKTTNARGRILLEAFSLLNITLANTGNAATFRRGALQSVVDLTFVSSSMIRHSKWHVSERYTHSDHQAIFLKLDRCNGRTNQQNNGSNSRSWCPKMFDRESFVDSMNSPIALGQTTIEKTVKIISQVVQACDVSMPRKRAGPKKAQNYWWNDEIASARTSCLRARRRYTRSRNHPEYASIREEYRKKRNGFKSAIEKSKRQCFKQLCDDANENPWGGAYRTVMAKIKGQRSPQITNPELLQSIIKELFPHQVEIASPQTDYTIENVAIPIITEEEMSEICRRTGDKKAPGPDGIPNTALKLAVTTIPTIFIDIFMDCLKTGTFPPQWKRQKLVLIPKAGKPPGEPSSYRPICLLDTVGKMLERVIYNRLLPIVENRGGLSERQFGFRKARSTVDAISMVVKIASKAIYGVRTAKEYCLVITLDIKNAFNSANWTRIKSALAKLEVPQYLASIIGSYLSERSLGYETDDGQKEYKVTAGVPQGSVLGPLLWNVLYNDVLNTTIPSEATIIGFADDIAVVVVAKHLDEVEMYARESIKQIKEWLDRAGLELAEHKTEAVLISSRKKLEVAKVKVGRSTICSKRVIKYLGVMLDARLSFNEHITYTCEKAANATSALSRMMPNIGGPRQSRRMVISRVVTSILLYAAPTWHNAVKNKANKRCLGQVYRRCALRICSAFRTTSDEAAYVVSGMIPVDILVEEMYLLYQEKTRSIDLDHTTLRARTRQESIRKWQFRWDQSTKGRWTHRLIPNVQKWINRRHGEVNYNLTQFLTGHGGYRKYLHRFGHEDSPECPTCTGVNEDPEHAVFHCPRFDAERNRLETGLNSRIDPQTIVDTMMFSQSNWDQVVTGVTAIQNKLRIHERERQSEEPAH